jgi:hypothetical protein
MRLVRGAAHKAIVSGTERITLDMLKDVYEDRLASNNPGYPNPFETKLEKLELLEANYIKEQLLPEKKGSKGKGIYAR